MIFSCITIDILLKSMIKTVSGFVKKLFVVNLNQPQIDTANFAVYSDFLRPHIYPDYQCEHIIKIQFQQQKKAINKISESGVTPTTIWIYLTSRILILCTYSVRQLHIHIQCNEFSSKQNCCSTIYMVNMCKYNTKQKQIHCLFICCIGEL